MMTHDAPAERRTETEAAPLDIAALERLDKEATPGPWRVGEIRHAGRYQLVMADSLSRGFICEVAAPLKGSDLDETAREANAALIAAVRNQLPALIERARVAEWQPIETAPKDGTEALFARDGAVGVYQGRWIAVGQIHPRRPEGWYWAGYDGAVGPIDPTHWMPLPAPPAGLLPKESEHG